MKSSIIYLLLIILPFIQPLKGQEIQDNCNPDAISITETRASETDGDIGFEPNKHFSFYNATCDEDRGVLLVHLVGSFAKPKNSQLYPITAANNGFHVVSLKYENLVAAKTACAESTDPDCFYKFRREIIEGVDVSTEVEVDQPNSIYNRLNKLLVYLNDEYPAQDWGQFLDADSVLWGKTMVSGHSQGGGHAAVIAIEKNVKRVLMFASPNDYSTHFNAPAGWTSYDRITPDSAYFGLNHLFDDVVLFAEQFSIWNNLNMPSFGDSVRVDISLPPYGNSHQLYTTFDTTGTGGNHSVMMVDSKIPLDVEGVPIFAPAWKYMLGVDQIVTASEKATMSKIGFSLFPNPTSDHLIISSDYRVVKIDIFDIAGRKIATFFKTNNLDLNELPAGVYFARIETSQRTLARTFIKN